MSTSGLYTHSHTYTHARTPKYEQLCMHTTHIYKEEECFIWAYSFTVCNGLALVLLGPW